MKYKYFGTNYDVPDNLPEWHIKLLLEYKRIYETPRNNTQANSTSLSLNKDLTKFRKNPHGAKMRYNTIYEGDCILGLKKLPDKSVDVVFTSPPYNRYSEYSDKIDDYLSFLKTFTDECLRVSNRLVIINIQKNFYNKKDVFKFIGEYSENIQEIVIWEKTNPMPAAGKSITNSYEFFIMMSKNPIKANSTYTKNIIATSVNGDMTKEHKAVMKQDVSDWFIQTFTDDKDIILDCFMGLGTTAASAIKYGRKWIGFEISPKYNEIAITRLSQGSLSGFFGTQANSTSSSFNKDPDEFPQILPLAELR